MSNKLEELGHELKELSVTELVSLIEQAAAELRRKTKDMPNGNGPVEASQTEDPVQRGVHLAHAYRPTKEEVEARMKRIFTPEELEEAAKVDLTQLPPLPKTITEYISEDREDRF